MIKGKYLILFLLSIGVKNTYAQFDSSLLKQRNIYEAIRIEESLGSILHKNDLSFGVVSDPLHDKKSEQVESVSGRIYKRVNDSFPTGMYVWYFPYSDSAIRQVTVNWGFYNNSSPLSDKQIIAICSGKEKIFVEKYEAIKSSLVKNIGFSGQEHTSADHENDLIKSTEWNTEDIFVRLVISYSRQPSITQHRGVVIVNASYYITATIYFKRKL